MMLGVVAVACVVACSSKDTLKDTLAIGHGDTLRASRRDTAAPSDSALSAITSRGDTPARRGVAGSISSATRTGTTANTKRTSADTAGKTKSDGATHRTTTWGVTPRQGVDRQIDRAVAAWSRVKTLRATFEQVVTNPITGSELTARGTLQQQKPSRLAITFSDPAGDQIVADGRYVWVYLQSATPGQVVKMSITDVGAANTDLIGQFLNTPRSKYDASDAGADRVGDRLARQVILTAKPGESLPFIRAKVWIDSADALIRQFEAVDANGISRKVRILTMSPNAPVDASAFRFDVPAGVRVVER